MAPGRWRCYHGGRPETFRQSACCLPRVDPRETDPHAFSSRNDGRRIARPDGPGALGGGKLARIARRGRRRFHPGPRVAAGAGAADRPRVHPLPGRQTGQRRARDGLDAQSAQLGRHRVRRHRRSRRVGQPPQRRRHRGRLSPKRSRRSQIAPAVRFRIPPGTRRAAGIVVRPRRAREEEAAVRLGADLRRGRLRRRKRQPHVQQTRAADVRVRRRHVGHGETQRRHRLRAARRLATERPLQQGPRESRLPVARGAGNSLRRKARALAGDEGSWATAAR